MMEPKDMNLQYSQYWVLSGIAGVLVWFFDHIRFNS